MNLTPTVLIDAVAYGGKGIARAETGHIIFIEGTVPGDLVEIEIIPGKAKKFLEARVLKFITPSPLRGQLSYCAVGHKCGGCTWPDVSYSQQRIWKKQFIESNLQRIGKLTTVPPINFIQTERSLNYRNRVLLKGRLTTSGVVKLGYFAKNSRDFVAIESCPIAQTKINEAIDFILKIKLQQKPHIETPFKIELQELPAKNGKVVAVLSVESKFKQHTAEFLDCLKESELFTWCDFKPMIAKAPSVVFDTQFAATFFTKPGLFQQVFPEMNQKVRERIFDLLSQIKPARVLDLYCGSGNLSLPLGPLESIEYIEGVEFEKKSIECALEGVAMLPSSIQRKYHYTSGDATRHLWKATQKNDQFDCVITDPPRQGMFEGLQFLRKISPAVICYLSCDPATLSRDIHTLTKDGYTLSSVDAIDFFPNTYHIETLAVLRKFS